MKKLLFIALGSIALSAMVFAKETVQNLDFSIPIDNRELDFDDDIGKITEKSTSFDFDYSMMTINESGFSFIFGANIVILQQTLKKGMIRLKVLTLV